MTPAGLSSAMDKKFKHRNGLGTGTGDSDVTSGESGVSHVPRQPPSTPSDLNVVKAAPAQRRGVSKASVPKKVRTRTCIQPSSLSCLYLYACCAYSCSGLCTRIAPDY